MIRAFLTLVAALTTSPAAGADGGAITIEVDNVRSSEGMVLVQLCPERQFMRRCTIGAHVAARAGTVTLVLAEVPPGDYAAMAFHDRNANGALDRWLGVPREDFGFSRMARLPLRPPRFRDAAFTHGAADQKIAIRLVNYFG